MKLDTIEAGRGLAALAVVLFHANTIAAAQMGQGVNFALLSHGERGVDFFFALSGFIIVLVHFDDLGRGERGYSFVLKRLIRIYPLLWLIAIPNFVANAVVDGEPIYFDKLFVSLTLVPSLEWPTPSVSWTLRHELLFYAVFAVAVFFRLFGLALAAAWLCLCLMQLFLLIIGTGLPGIWAMIFSPINLGFGFGALAGWFYLRRPHAPAFGPLCLGLAALLALFIAFEAASAPHRTVLDYGNAEASLWDAGFGAVFAIIVLGLALLARRFHVPRWMVFLGSASYAVYLAHAPVAGLAGRYLVGVIPSELASAGGAHLALATVGVIAGCLIHILLERPATQRLRRIVLRSQRALDVNAKPPRVAGSIN